MLYVRSQQKVTMEYTFLTSFINSSFFNKYKNLEQYDYTLIQEPFTGIGYPDLVCVIWKKNLIGLWNDKRNKLKKDDIKILHFLYSVKQKKSLTDISEQLGFGIAIIEKSIERLLDADVIKEVRGQYSIELIGNVFFIKDIISIEAKLNNWRKAFDQARYNCLFSSNSFVLFPSKVITANLLNAYEGSDIGIITFDEDYKIVKTAKRNKIPSTINSWQFNEYIGRTVWNKKLTASAVIN
jgi:predicted transcriptional regulator